MKKISYNKLIRDKIPEKIRRNGGEFEIRKLSAREFERELLKKVGEEASALPALTAMINHSARKKTKAKKELASELADIIAVIDEIKKVRRISEKELAAALAENFARKGGFRKKLFLIWSSDTGYRTNERRYKK